MTMQKFHHEVHKLTRQCLIVEDLVNGFAQHQKEERELVCYLFARVTKELSATLQVTEELSAALRKIDKLHRNNLDVTIPVPAARPRLTVVKDEEE